MNRLHQLLALLGVAAIALAACGGGGGNTTPSAAKAGSGGLPAGFVRHSVAVPPMSARTSVGNVKLALTLPHVFQGKNALAIRAKGGSALASAAARRTNANASRRSPAFVDPYGCGPNNSCYYAILDIFVDGTLLTNIDGCAGPYDSMCVQTNSDGTQTLNLPLFSTGTNDVVVAEFDSCGNECQNLLALGETWVGSFTPGTAVNATLTMQMNAAGVGILDLYNQADPEILNGQNYLGLSGTCNGSPYPQIQQFGLFTADDNGSFVATAGYGGVSTPSLTYASDAPGTTTAPASNISGLYFVNWDNNCDGVTVTGTATNPAYAIFSSTTDYYGPLDGNGNETDGYVNCYNHQGPCPGGPYQGLWDMWYPYGEPFYPQDDIYGPTVTGSVNILNAPPASPPPASPSPMPSADYSSSLTLTSSITYPNANGIGISATLDFVSTPSPLNQTVYYDAYNYLPQPLPTNPPNSMPSPVGVNPNVVASWWFANSVPTTIFLGNAGPTAIFSGVQCPAPTGQYYTYFADFTGNVGQGYQAQSSCLGNTVTFNSSGGNPAYLNNGDTYVLELTYF